MQGNIYTRFNPTYDGFSDYSSFEHAIYLPKHEGPKEPEMPSSRTEHYWEA